MLTSEIHRTAQMSACGRHRVLLTRQWDERPRLLVVMFNPSLADASIDDPTISLVCAIASHNGFGGVVVTNGISLRSSAPGPAHELVQRALRGSGPDHELLQENLAVIVEQAQRAGAVLLAWGALAGKTPASALWFEKIRWAVGQALPDGAGVLCLGKTKAGFPLHPLARGKLKVRKDAQLLPWSAVQPARRGAQARATE